MNKQIILSDLFNMKSRMKGDLHVRFRENAGVKFLCMTRCYYGRSLPRVSKRRNEFCQKRSDSGAKGKTRIIEN
jgi:hypothetical protein